VAPEINLRVKANMTSLSSKGFHLSLPVKFGPGTQVDLNSKVLDSLNFNKVINKKSPRMASLVDGLFLNEFDFTGLTESERKVLAQFIKEHNEQKKGAA